MALIPFMQHIDNGPPEPLGAGEAGDDVEGAGPASAGGDGKGAGGDGDGAEGLWGSRLIRYWCWR